MCSPCSLLFSICTMCETPTLPRASSEQQLHSAQASAETCSPFPLVRQSWLSCCCLYVIAPLNPSISFRLYSVHPRTQAHTDTHWIWCGGILTNAMVCMQTPTVHKWPVTTREHGAAAAVLPLSPFLPSQQHRHFLTVHSQREPHHRRRLIILLL